MLFLDYLFVDNYLQLSLLMVIVFIASIVRGCIGFGLSVLGVASTSFWLEIKYVVVVVVLLELLASLVMIKAVREEIDFHIFTMLSISGVVSSVIGVWFLVILDKPIHQFMISVYLLAIVTLVLSRFMFRKPINSLRLFMIGSVAGFYNGLAGIGGIFVATMLTSSRVQVKHIRATVVVYFFLVEAVFFAAAAYNDL